MENRQTQTFVRTAYDLERKYNLSSLPSTKKAVEQQKDQLNKTTNELENYIISSTAAIDDLKNQIDGEVVTWFYDGTPTLVNEPANGWADYETKNNHTGDIYYDIQTGYVYSYSYNEDEEIFEWVKLENSDVSSAMAVANADRDTSDHKRTIYTLQPTTPYEVGDVWLKDDGSLYRCAIARQETDTYHDIDWILATDYSSETAAKNSIAQLSAYKTLVKTNYVTNAVLTIDSDAIDLRVSNVETLADSKAQVFTGTPTTPYNVGDVLLKTTTTDDVESTLIYVCQVARTKEETYQETDFSLQPTYSSNAELKVESDRITELTGKTVTIQESIDGINTKIAGVDTNTNDIVEIKKSVETLQDESSRTIEITTDIQKNGVSQVRTENDYTFDKDGLHINDSSSNIASTLDNEGLEVVDTSGSSDERLFYAGVNNDGESVVETKNINIDKYLVMDKWRIEEVNDDTNGVGLGFFYMGE